MTDTVPDRAQLVAALTDQWDALARLVDGLDETAWRKPSALPGWTVFDVLAHIIGTESILLGEPTPDLDVTGEHIRNDVGTLNEKWIESLRPLTGQQLLERFREVTAKRAQALAEISPERWAEELPTPVGMASYGRFMRIRLFDCWMHEHDIADGLGVSVDEGGPRAEAGFPELLTGLGRSAVKGAGALDGATLTIELTGPVTRNLHIAVTGKRANLVESLDDPADTTLSLDSRLFARFCGGRTLFAGSKWKYAVAGDFDLGERLAHSLAFTL
ncbi:maleylpyruvate isomerase family mycothiol-dependent enzyme [Nocardia sp. NPDC020380]|uniref:maleylpyruvate isomerase family mycothiol-dependent enzyme n=1 Tax=Nocardia sp. NPDC020380 TaxID=3364309 RepID=UPI0037B70436